MGQFFKIHPINPQRRLLERAAEILSSGGVIVYPTDSIYALGCPIGDKEALGRIQRIRNIERDHDFTLVCRDLSEIATYARVDNQKYRLLRSLTPGPYTFSLQATHEVPKRLQDPKKRSIGIRVPSHPVAAALLEVFGGPVMSSTLLLPDEDLPMTDPEEIRSRLGKQVDAIIDSGVCGVEPTTILDLSGDSVAVVRRGKGDASAFQS
ncbi:MAG TPA: L-threonylcarbamoyladenylate synthase [Bryobacteraceae bacterium]|nr:L-threonylcarbamoyladenylate synthase [Bryobacteraceae bacterium]